MYTRTDVSQLSQGRHSELSCHGSNKHFQLVGWTTRLPATHQPITKPTKHRKQRKPLSCTRPPAQVKLSKLDLQEAALGPKHLAPGSSSGVGGAALLLWRLRCYADEFLSASYNVMMEVGAPASCAFSLVFACSFSYSRPASLLHAFFVFRLVRF